MKLFLKSSLAILILANSMFAQEAIKFQIPLDSNGMPIPVVTAPKPDTIQKLGLAQNLPLNLAALSAKDTASFETYSKRYALVQDSIAATYRAMESVKKNAQSFMQPLEPKGEFEKQAEYEAREAKWNSELKQLQERDTRSLTLRLAELEKAKIKIQENQTSLYASIDIKTNPPAASIWIGREEIGATPAEYKLLIPGDVKINLRKEGYRQFDTTLKVTPAASFKLSVVLEERSIFNQEKELNFSKLLTKDTTVQGYLARIETVKVRKAEVNEELKQVLVDFSNTYPALQPQRPDETPEAFKKRQEIWAKEGLRQYGELQKKSESYHQKLDRSVQTLNDYIVATQSSIISEAALGAKIELGAYDSEKETFEIKAQDIANEKSPFYFSGKISVPLDKAKTIDRNAHGISASLMFLNFPFETDSAKVNLAMSKIQLSMGGQSLNVNGTFGEMLRYKSMNGYDAWKLRADSLLSGSLKSQGFDYNYAMGKAAIKDAVAESSESSGSSGLGWRGWTRIVAYTLAAGCASAAVVKNIKVNKYKDNITDLDRNPPSEAGYAAWRKNYSEYADVVKNNENQRFIYGMNAGVLALFGTATFLF